MDIVIVLFGIVVLLFSAVLHEVAHGLMALSLGDETAKHAGRLTLNPLKHIDAFGSIVLPIITYALAGFGFAYAKPVPYNPLNLRDRRFGPAKVACAGPAVNFGLAVLFGVVLRFHPMVLDTTILPQLLQMIVRINLALAILNIMPIPPLDGHWILFAFLPHRLHYIKEALVRYGTFLFIGFILFVFPLLYPLINFLFRAIVGFNVG